MKRKKILLLADDLRMSSGVATMSAEIVRQTIHEFDWVQLGGAIDHPEKGKEIDLSDAVMKDWGTTKREDGTKPYLKIYPVAGYGSQPLVRMLLGKEKPDAIMIYTDPRFWIWLFQMEHEIRQEIPILYYNIWDDLPYPMWNREYYDSVDSLFNISKQTVNIVKNVRSTYEDWQATYIPHGINEKVFKPLTDEAGLKDVADNKSKFKKDFEFILFYNARNIRRKLPGDLILAWKTFVDMLPEDKKDKVAFLMHTSPVDQNGTDLVKVKDAIAGPDANIFFSTNQIKQEELNVLYNMADVCINIASNEGFGLGTCEALMAGTPIIVNVTGGMQDQCGFKYKDKLLTDEDYSWVHSLHDAKKWKDNPDLTHGEWVKPIWPTNRSLQGSPPTPYIFDDRPSWEDAADRIYEWYKTPKEERKKAGLKGREFCLMEETGLSADNMGKRFINDINTVFEKFKPRKRYEMFKS